jgi:hypothetical protein
MGEQCEVSLQGVIDKYKKDVEAFRAENAELREVVGSLLDYCERTMAGFQPPIELYYATRDFAKRILIPTPPAESAREGGA